MNIRSKLGRAVGHARTIAANKQAKRAASLLAVAAVAAMPGLALAGGGGGTPWETMGESVLDIFQNGLTRSIAIISIIACGIAALAGKLQWSWAINIIIGVVLIFGGAAMIDFLITAAES